MSHRRIHFLKLGWITSGPFDSLFSFLQKKAGEECISHPVEYVFSDVDTSLLLNLLLKKLNLFLQAVDSRLSGTRYQPLPELIYHLELHEWESNPHSKQHVLHGKYCIIPGPNDAVNSINKNPGRNSNLLQLQTNSWLKINSVVISFIMGGKQSPTKCMCLRTCCLLVNGR